ncbi:DUF72 domain-containing protein [Hoyosella altamirensis]|uniref:DUF72 domain-containing protein n=1 Tax=Hoyosella altamirensis TaxID=616997 RepID=UPI000AF729F6|nr:DUF72 domain-containing protein [Hoyosella altamirensis]
MIRIGTSGWVYPRWRGTFYPKALVQRRELEYMAQRLNSVEINGSFYALQRPESYQKWAAETPEDFVFAVKAPRFITHMKRLVDVDAPLANFFASGVLALEGRLGPVLWQLPPNLRFDERVLAEFLAKLPMSTAAAAELATQHDDKVAGRAYTTTDEDRPLRHAIEVRHPSFDDPAVPRLLRDSGVALVIADSAGRYPYFEDITADFVYIRLHGAEELYVSGYTSEALDEWAAKIRAWGKDTCVYFDNDVKVRAPFDAMALRERLQNS